MQPTSDQIPPDDAERIPLAPIPTPPAPDPSSMIARLQPLDWLLALALLAFAFLVASFKAANSDVFLHLATGRLIAQGQYPFGQDPFTFAASGWINQAWLYSLGLFAAYNLTGPDGVGLVVLKAVAVSATALLMFLGGMRPGDRGWIPAMCAALGVLAMSPRLLLTPLVASLFLLAAVFFLLSRHETGSRRAWLIPILCALWVNCDAWFFLGPMVVLLYAAGEAIQGGKEVKTFGLIGVGSLAACVVNPYHVMAFTALPPELLRAGPALELVREMFGDWHLTVFDPRWYRPTIGLSAAGVSFFLLAGMGLGSFAAAFPKVSYARALVFVPMLGLALMGYRMIPLFAAVAAPVAALNFLDAADRLFGAEAFARREWRAWAVGGRMLSLLVLIAGCVLSVPGLLQVTPHASRRLGFGLVIEEGLKASALRAADLREQGVIEDGERWLNLGPEAVAYYAWYCPGQKCFLDHRIGIYPEDAVRDYLAARRSLQGEDRPDREPGQEPAWRAVMRGNRLRFVVFHSFNLDFQQPTLNRLFGWPDEWTPCFVGGRSSLFAWHEPGTPSSLDPRAVLDFDAAAFGPKAVPVSDEPGPPLTFLDALTGETPPTTAEAWASQQHVARFDAVSNRMKQDNQRKFLATVAVGLAGTGSGTGNAAALTVSLRHRLTMAPAFMASYDAGPPSSAYLAMRAAREAIRQNPLDHRGYHSLAQAVGRLNRETREQARTRGLPHATVIRRGQSAWAIREALRLDPPKPVRLLLHYRLMEAFQGGEYVDQLHEQVAGYVKLARELRYLPGASPDRAEKEMEEMEKGLRAQERDLEKRRDDYVVQSARLPAGQRAIKALERGLANEAIKALSAAKNEELAAPLDREGTTGLQLLVRLKLDLGFVADARDRLNPETSPGFDPRMLGRHPFGLPAYDWFRVQLAATVGDYDSADAALADMARQARSSAGMRLAPVAVADGLMHGARLAVRLPGDHLAQIALPFPAQVGGWPLAWQGTLALAQQNAVDVVDQAATMTTLRAWLALERGKTEDAARWAKEGFNLADLGPTPDGSRLIMQLRSVPLAVLIRQLTQR